MAIINNAVMNKLDKVTNKGVKKFSSKRNTISEITGKPIIHFVHANGIPSLVYAPVFKRLSDKFTIVFIPVLGREEPLNVEWDKVEEYKKNQSKPKKPTKYKGSNKYPIQDQWTELTQQIIDSVEAVCQKHHVDSVIGLGHSLGALCTLQAIYRQPEIFTKAVLMDPPMIYGSSSFVWHFAKLSSRSIVDKLSPAGISKNRRDVWDSRQQARDSLSVKGFFKVFDPRCFDNYIQYGLTEVSADLEPKPDTDSDSRVNDNDNVDHSNNNKSSNSKDSSNNNLDNGNKVTLTISKSEETKVFRTNPSLYWLKPNRAPKVPVTLIIGKDSLFYKRKFPQKIQKRLKIPFVLHDGGHMFPLEQPESVADRIVELLYQI